MELMKPLNKILLLPVLIVVGLIIFLNLPKTKPFIIEKNQPVSTSTINVILAGDIMLDRGVAYMIEKYGNNDPKFPFLKIADYFKTADVVFGNLEGPVSNKGEKVGSIYSFRANPNMVEGLNFAGFNVISMANNHAFDYGREAFEDTMKRLKTTGIDCVGADFSGTEAFSPVIKNVDDIKIGFLAYTNLGSPYWEATTNTSGLAWINEGLLGLAKQQIKTAKEKVNILIVSLHAGEEYQKTPTQFQIDFSRMAIDAGADIIVGHHPHVVQPDEIYKDKYIFYSLGNFIFDQSFSEETMQGEIVKVLIEDKKIKEAVPIDIKINGYFQPEILTNN